MPRSLHSPGPRWPRARSLMLALATLLTVAAPATARADLCWLGMKARTGATAVVIDGVQAAGEWTGASSQGPAAGCVSRLLDGSPTNPAAVDATVYTMRDGSFLYFFFDVPDATTPKTSTSIGDFIILQIDPNHAVTTSLETGAGNRSHEHRFEFYTWRDAGGTGSTDQLLYFNSLPGATQCAPTTSWASHAVPGGGAVQFVHHERTGGYTVEGRINMGDVLGVNASALSIGISFAIVNDMGNDADFSGAAFPSTLPFTNANNAGLHVDPQDPTGCQDWLNTRLWGGAYFQNAPASDPQISRGPDWWNSDGITLSNCGVAGYSYYPKHPCRIAVNARITNAGVPTRRNIMYLWGNRDAGNPLWSGMGTITTVVVPTGGMDVPSIEWRVPPSLWALQEHPCMRVVILPDVFQSSPFDSTSMANWTDKPYSTFQNLMTKYTLADKNWAQKNITRIENTNQDCANGACLSLADSAWPSLARLSARMLRVAVVPMTQLIDLRPQAAWAQPPKPRNAVPVPAIMLSPGDLRQYGATDVVVQVRTFGWGPRRSGRYNIIEPVSGAIDLIPYKRIVAERRIPIEYRITNKDDISRTMLVQLVTRFPNTAGDVRVTLPTQEVLRFEPGQRRVIRGMVEYVPVRRGCLGQASTAASVAFVGAMVFVGFTTRRRRDDREDTP